MQFIEAYNLTGIIIGLITFLVIGIFHPLVVKGEYFFGVKCWWVFLLLGIGGMIAAILLRNVIASTSCGVFAFHPFGQSENSSNNENGSKKVGSQKGKIRIK